MIGWRLIALTPFVLHHNTQSPLHFSSYHKFEQNKHDETMEIDYEYSTTFRHTLFIHLGLTALHIISSWITALHVQTLPAIYLLAINDWRLLYQRELIRRLDGHATPPLLVLYGIYILIYPPVHPLYLALKERCSTGSGVESLQYYCLSVTDSHRYLDVNAHRIQHPENPRFTICIPFSGNLKQMNSGSVRLFSEDSKFAHWK